MTTSSSETVRSSDWRDGPSDQHAIPAPSTVNDSQRSVTVACNTHAPALPPETHSAPAASCCVPPLLHKPLARPSVAIKQQQAGGPGGVGCCRCHHNAVPNTSSCIPHWPSTQRWPAPALLLVPAAWHVPRLTLPPQHACPPVRKRTNTMTSPQTNCRLSHKHEL